MNTTRIDDVIHAQAISVAPLHRLGMENRAPFSKIFFNGRHSARAMQDSLTFIVWLTEAVEEASAT